MSQLDTSVVNVGLETVAHDLHAGLARTQWVANGYLLALAVSLPACGWLTRGVGPSRLWLGALAGFTASSALCALAGSLEWLIGLRVLQGLSAGLLIPTGQTVIGRAVGPARLGRVMGTVGIALTLAPALGPSAGGLLLHLASWPWLFWVNVPLGVAGLALGLRYLPKTAPDAGAAGRLDWLGLALVSVGVPVLVFGFTTWGEHGSPTRTVAGALALAVLALGGFGVRSLRRRAVARPPVLDLRLYRNPRYAAASATVGFTGAAMFGAGLLFPLYFQLGRGEGVLATGLLLITMSIGTSVALPLAGRLVDRYGGGPVSLAGGLATVATTVPFALLELSADQVLVQALLLVRGAALAAAVMPATTAAYQAVDAARLPDATTQVNILLRVGGALGGAVFTVILTGGMAAGAASAFHSSFWWLTGASALGLAGAGWLALAECRGR
ncbi:MAG: DHA2 family efflux MFS transporter permease subunit [Pseudonocardia sp.]|nr:DHA2 family efflux MFS transporter permease subunit [Pseudonocardia sp.]